MKEVYEVSPRELEFFFTDQISVFDKVIPTQVPHKGETLCRTSAHWFQVVEDLGIRTHFLRLEGGDRMRVRRVEVIPDYDKIMPTTKNFLIPLEVIARYYVAGSFHDRIKGGRIQPEDAGFPAGHMPAYGEPLPEPFVEVTTKLEKVDRELTRDEALAISKLSRAEYNDLVDAVLKIDARLNEDVERRGLIHVDAVSDGSCSSTRSAPRTRIGSGMSKNTRGEGKWNSARNSSGNTIARSGITKPLWTRGPRGNRSRTSRPFPMT